MRIHRLSFVGSVAVVAALMATSPVLAVPGSRMNREEKKVVEATGKTSITIKNPRGRTVVVGKPGISAVTVIAVKNAQGKDDTEAGQMLDKLAINISEHGDQVQVETQDDNSWSDGSSIWSLVKGGRRSAWIDYTIEVPFAFGVTATSTSGDVRVSNIGGNGNVSSTSGDVSVRAVDGDAVVHVTSGDLEAIDIGGDLSAVATSGDVTIDNVKGKLKGDATSGDLRASRVGKDAEIRLASGNVVLEGCSGDASVRTASGDARLNEVQGSIDASSSSGDIEVQIVPAKDRAFNFSSSSGDITVYYVPIKDFGFNLEVRTSSGSIEGDLPIKVSRVDRRRLQGIVGSGAARVDIETASGDVSIMEQGESARK